MEDLVLTDEEQRKIEEGEAADLLLNDPAFLLAIERVREQCAEAILQSAPTDGALRDHNYHLSRALTAVTAELVAMAATGQTVLDNATRPQADQDVQAPEPDDLLGDF